MLQFIWKNFPEIPVTSEVHNRTIRVRLAERVSAAALRDQMEHVRTLRYLKSELIWLAGNTFYGIRSIFEPQFLSTGSKPTSASATTKSLKKMANSSFVSPAFGPRSPCGRSTLSPSSAR